MMAVEIEEAMVVVVEEVIVEEISTEGVLLVDLHLALQVTLVTTLSQVMQNKEGLGGGKDLRGNTP